jgi:predicted dehydrogenase
MTEEVLVRWGIIGLGKIAGRFAESLAYVPDSRLWAVASRSADKAEQFGGRFSVPFRYADYDGILSNPEVDIIYIATPHSEHHALALRCLNQGKAVLCEKPLALNSRQVEEMIATARQQQRFLMEALWTKFMPPYQKLTRLIASGAIGSVNGIHANFGMRTEYQTGHRLFDPRLGGGGLLDIGIYPVFLAVALMGRPEKLQAMATLTESGVDDNCHITMDFGHKAYAQLSCSLTTTTSLEAEIYGSNGFIKMHNPFHGLTALSVYDAQRQFVETFRFDIPSHGLQYEAAEATRCLREGLAESPLMRHSESQLLMETLDRIRQQIGVRYNCD